MPDEISTDGAATLAWLKQICADAIEASRAGDTMPANRLGANSAISHYFHNVAQLGSLTPESWTVNYPYHLKECDRVRRSQEHAAAQEGRLQNIEAQLAQLLSLLGERGEKTAEKPTKKKTAD